MNRRSEHTTKVFVGSLPPNVTAEDLRQLFTPYGEIAECDIANRCGFLHLEDKELAEKAINELNNTTFMGARISVEMGRVKPRGERRMRGGMVGGRGGVGVGGLGRRRDMGPYTRDGATFGRGGMARNGGNYREDYRNYDEYQEYDRGYDERYDRRQMYDGGRGGGNGGNGGGYMNDRNAYGNGYDRRPYDNGQFAAGMQQQQQQAGPYDSNRMQAGAPATYDDGRRAAGRPLIDEQNMNQAQMRQQTYEQPRAQNDMFSRRDGPPKAITGYDRSAQGAATYAAYGQTTATSYGTAVPATAATYGAPMASYAQQMPAGGYGDSRGTPAPAYDARQTPMAQQQQGYATAQTGYNTAPAAGPTGGGGGAAGGGYGDQYGMRATTNTYDTAYPPLPQQQRGYGEDTPAS